MTDAPRSIGYSRRDTGSLPQGWEAAWGSPSPFLRRQLDEIRASFERLARSVPCVDKETTFGGLVGSSDLRTQPIHRWYFYKEAFSPSLPRTVREHLNVDAPVAADVFGGVGTTALSLQGRPDVTRVLSVEYSPFAHFAGTTKLAWPRLDHRRLRRLAQRLSRYEIDYSLPYPSLAAFENPEIFSDEALVSLLSAREHVRATDMRRADRDFFMLGLASVVESASGAMKDGRALRILRGRTRRLNSLTPIAPFERTGEVVRDLLIGQWQAMIEDVESLAPRKRAASETEVLHLRGDARDLGLIKRSSKKPAFEADSVGSSCFSPPYLNCIDYSEVYKLELWLLEFIRTPDEFRDLRLGTLRSHPSVTFPERAYAAGVVGDVTDTVDAVATFVARHGMRPNEARMIPGYFDDMYRVFTQQYWALEPGAWMACVVANSTFSRRLTGANGREELWRIPVLTDVLLAHLARAAGFEEVEIWSARHLRPRNVASAAAREAIVIGRKSRG